VWKSYLGALVGWPIRGNGDGRKRVGKMCTTGEKFADELLTDVLETWTTKKITEFSAPANRNTLNTCREKCRPQCAPSAFPRIHSAHHNNKGLFCFVIL
jgi:hypothetical protein